MVPARLKPELVRSAGTHHLGPLRALPCRKLGLRQRQGSSAALRHPAKCALPLLPGNLAAAQSHALQQGSQPCLTQGPVPFYAQFALSLELPPQITAHLRRLLSLQRIRYPPCHSCPVFYH